MLKGYIGRRLLLVCVLAVIGKGVCADDPTSMIVVVGASGTEEYGQAFSQWADHWRDVAKESGAAIDVIGIKEPTPDTSDRDELKELIEKSSGQTDSPLWLILIGHGTYARQTAKFNLRGPDVSGAEIADWVSGVTRPLVIVNCASSSGPFINRLSASGRVVVTSTKSGTEQNYSRFGKFFSEAIGSAESDLDHDDAVSVHEAFLRASAKVKEFYDNEARISTEHALIDDNGDGRGTPAKMFKGVRAIATAKDGAELDGNVAKRITLAPVKNQLSLTSKQKKQRDELEKQLDQMRGSKDQLEEDEYLQEIEPILIKLANIYRAAEESAKEKK